MAIDIKGITGNSLTPRKITGRTSERGRPAAGESTSRGDEKLSITDTAMSLENMDRLMAQIPIVDANRVETVRESLSRGNYEVDPERTAEKFIQFELMLNRSVVEHAHA